MNVWRTRAVEVRFLRALTLLELSVALIGTAYFVPVCTGQDQELPSQRSNQSTASESYRIAIGDELRISVWREPGLSSPAIVRPDGTISMPLLNEVPVAGLTTKQLQELLTERLTMFVNAPRVNVLVAQVETNPRPTQPRPWSLPEPWPRG
jgi:hypothetical protein